MFALDALYLPCVSFGRCEDFYDKIATGTVPEHDILITNPPYSADHMEKIFQFCAAENRDRPWFVLVPHFVYTKNWWQGDIANVSVLLCYHRCQHERKCAPMPPPLPT